MNTSHDYKLSDITGTSKAVSVNGTQTLTNKTLVDPTLSLGSDAIGDTYYRSAGGTTTRLAIGTANQVMTVSGGVPSWQTPGTVSAPKVKVSRPVSTPVANNSEVPITFTVENFDTDTMWGTSTPTRITFTTAGVYSIQGNCVWEENTVGRRYSLIRSMGSTILSQSDANVSTANGVATHHHSVLYSATASEYIELFVLQSSGGTISLTGTPITFSAYRVA